MGWEDYDYREKARKLGVPLLEPKEETPKPEFNPTVAVCGLCGIEVKKVMLITCKRDGCPCFKSIGYWI